MKSFRSCVVVCTLVFLSIAYADSAFGWNNAADADVDYLVIIPTGATGTAFLGVLEEDCCAYNDGGYTPMNYLEFWCQILDGGSNCVAVETSDGTDIADIIKDYYQTDNTSGARYVLLVGNASMLPTNNGIDWNYDSVPTDECSNPDSIFIGRYPVSSADELRRMRTKTLRFMLVTLTEIM